MSSYKSALKSEKIAKILADIRVNLEPLHEELSPFAREHLQELGAELWQAFIEREMVSSMMVSNGAWLAAELEKYNNVIPANLDELKKQIVEVLDIEIVAYNKTFPPNFDATTNKLNEIPNHAANINYFRVYGDGYVRGMHTKDEYEEYILPYIKYLHKAEDAKIKIERLRQCQNNFFNTMNPGMIQLLDFNALKDSSIENLKENAKVLVKNTEVRLAESKNKMDEIDKDIEHNKSRKKNNLLSDEEDHKVYNEQYKKDYESCKQYLHALRAGLSSLESIDEILTASKTPIAPQSRIYIAAHVFAITVCVVMATPGVVLYGSAKSAVTIGGALVDKSDIGLKSIVAAIVFSPVTISVGAIVGLFAAMNMTKHHIKMAVNVDFAMKNKLLDNIGTFENALENPNELNSIWSRFDKFFESYANLKPAISKSISVTYAFKNLVNARDIDPKLKADLIQFFKIKNTEFNEAIDMAGRDLNDTAVKKLREELNNFGSDIEELIGSYSKTDPKKFVDKFDAILKNQTISHLPLNVKKPRILFSSDDYLQKTTMHKTESNVVELLKNDISKLKPNQN